MTNSKSILNQQSYKADKCFIETYQEEVSRLAEKGLYDPSQEHDSCGVGLITTLNGKPSRRVVESAIEALKRVWHRGAVDADGKTGDGAGIHVQIPWEFFKEHIRRTGHNPGNERLAVGMLFLPRTDLSAQELCRTIVETEIIKAGYSIIGWRQVPINVDVIGEKANATRPEIEQIMIATEPNFKKENFERDLFIIRRRIENQVQLSNINEFYICSFSCRSIIYKGMFLAEQLSSFFPDLQDVRFVSNFAIYHQRYSTNTFPTWPLAQPFRMLAHNGEINTLTGNIRLTQAHEPKISSPIFGSNISDLKPIIKPGSSDSAALDSVFELLCRAGRSAPLVKAMMIPESIGQNKEMPQHHAVFFSYCNAILEPWDGPAAICATDGEWAVAGLDRNGLRPMRYLITNDELFAVGSETGMVEIPEASIIEKGRVGPGGLIAINLNTGKFYSDTSIKDFLAQEHPYSDWVENIFCLGQDQIEGDNDSLSIDPEQLVRRQHCFGLSMEDIEMLLRPMLEDGSEAVGSMGDDAPLAVLSDRYRGLHHFFRQTFSQVTNPPIDSLREREVMSLKTRLGNLGNILEDGPKQCDLLQLDSPVLTNTAFDSMYNYFGATVAQIDCTFQTGSGIGSLSNALQKVQKDAEEAVRGGKTHIVLSDLDVDQGSAPVPMILATAAVHSHLIREELRTFTSLNIRSGECLDVHYFAVLIGVGATTVNAYLAEEIIRDRSHRGLLNDLSVGVAIKNYKAAIDKGLLKIMSKMGISIVSSYRGGYCFEALGLSRSLVAQYFPGMSSRLSGIGLSGIEGKVVEMHWQAFRQGIVPLPVGGMYKYRTSGERHGHDGNLIHTLQSAVSSESYKIYKRYSKGVRNRAPIYLRDLLDFQSDRKPLRLGAPQSVTEVRKKLVAPGISLGALSPEAHETLSIAMNRIGAKSDSGEGGEDPERYKPRPNGDNPSSAIKQIASGRFGVTAEYLNNCKEIEIKIAQGAKPGEGGQLPGLKVTEVIARLRYSTPGVTLISPPPHHDIYSIEDLAQLIYDLKQINPAAYVCVKLVARSGVGTIAAGVAKAKADVILISGHDGGTGASPQSSIKYVGIPWEMGLAEANQVLTLNKLRHNVKLRVDGGFKTGRDVVIAAMLGADEYGIGTTSLVAMGCIMVRQCHSNTCPVGVCSQDPVLREKFLGTPEKVVNLFTFIAEEVTEILAKLGYGSIEEIIGRTDLLVQVSRGAKHLDDLDLNPMLQQADSKGLPRHYIAEKRNEVPDSLDSQILADAKATFEHGEKMQLTYSVRNTHRAVGTRTSSLITRRFGMDGLAPNHLTIRLRGSAGQSLGAFAVKGLTLEVLGDANDYVGKGLSGGTIVVKPTISSPLQSEKNTIIGNTVLYGATAGRLYAAGQAGERFCVRNSGAHAVVEGCGSNACEYMTGGVVAVLGSVGSNFGAGMTGGMAFVYDPDGKFELRANSQTIFWHTLETEYWKDVLKVLVQQHVKRTNSMFGVKLLNTWEREEPSFLQIVPKEMKDKLEYPTTLEGHLSIQKEGV